MNFDRSFKHGDRVGFISFTTKPILPCWRFSMWVGEAVGFDLDLGNLSLGMNTYKTVRGIK